MIHRKREENYNKFINEFLPFRNKLLTRLSDVHNVDTSKITITPHKKIVEDHWHKSAMGIYISEYLKFKVHYHKTSTKKLFIERYNFTARGGVFVTNTDKHVELICRDIFNSLFLFKVYEITCVLNRKSEVRFKDS